MTEFTKPNILKLPDVRISADQKALPVQHVTVNNLRYILTTLGVGAGFDISRAEAVYQHPDIERTAVAQEQAELMILDMCTRLGMKGDAKIREILGALARAEPFHPMEEWVKTLEWDGQDRIGELIASVTTDNELWPVYLENWLIQTVEGVCGWRREVKRPLPHVLVLVGGQGIGKSQWLKSLGAHWFKGEAELHLSTSSGKDHQIAALRFPMVELSELGVIFRKSDIDTMKSFLTRDEDEIRAPYERRALVRPRMTSFCGSVNAAEFLNDTSGSRRFWPVQVESIDWGVKADLGQLWAQAYAFWQEDSSFDLTAEEDAIRAAVAIDMHTSESDEAETIHEYLRMHAGMPTKPMSALDVLKLLYGKTRSFNNTQRADASRIMHDIYGKHRTINGKQRCWEVPYNEFASDKDSWPDKITHLSLVGDSPDPK